MSFTVRCGTLPAAAFAIATTFLGACARVGSEAQVACPPVLQYRKAETGAGGRGGCRVARERTDRSLVGRLCRAQGAGAGVWAIESEWAKTRDVQTPPRPIALRASVLIGCN